MKRHETRLRFQRWGAATVEMAVVTPILLGLVFAIIEYGWIFMLQANVTSATREATRVGILPGTTDTDIRARFAEAVSGTGLNAASPGGSDGYTLEITRASSPTQTVTVRARVPWSKASLVAGGILPNPRRLLDLFGSGSSSERTADMVASCSMFKEGTQ